MEIVRAPGGISCGRIVSTENLLVVRSTVLEVYVGGFSINNVLPQDFATFLRYVICVQMIIWIERQEVKSPLPGYGP